MWVPGGRKSRVTLGAARHSAVLTASAVGRETLSAVSTAWARAPSSSCPVGATVAAGHQAGGSPGASREQTFPLTGPFPNSV